MSSTIELEAVSDDTLKVGARGGAIILLDTEILQLIQFCAPIFCESFLQAVAVIIAREQAERDAQREEAEEAEPIGNYQ
jgi:hypothetical protein